MVIFNSYVSLPEDNHLEKYEFVNGKDDIPYMKWEKMFQTTNQYIYIYICQVEFMVNLELGGTPVRYQRGAPFLNIAGCPDT